MLTADAQQQTLSSARKDMRPAVRIIVAACTITIMTDPSGQATSIAALEILCLVDGRRPHADVNP